MSFNVTSDEWAKFHRRFNSTLCPHCAMLKKSHTSKRRQRSSEFLSSAISLSPAHLRHYGPEKTWNKENGNSQTAIKKMNGMRTWFMPVCTHLYMLCLMSLYYGIFISFRCCSAVTSSYFLFSFSLDLWLLKSHVDQFIVSYQKFTFEGGSTRC